MSHGMRTNAECTAIRQSAHIIFRHRKVPSIRWAGAKYDSELAQYVDPIRRLQDAKLAPNRKIKLFTVTARRLGSAKDRTSLARSNLAGLGHVSGILRSFRRPFP